MRCVIRYDETEEVMRSTGDAPGMLVTKSDGFTNWRFGSSPTVELTAREQAIAKAAPRGGATMISRPEACRDAVDLTVEEVVGGCVDLVAVSMVLKMTMAMLAEVVDKRLPLGHFEAIEEMAAFAREVRDACNARASDFG